MSGVVVTALGCHSPVGVGVEQTCSSIRSGIARFQLNESFLARMPDLAPPAPPDAIRYAPAPMLTDIALNRRFVVIATKVMVELAQRSGLTRAELRDTHLFLALPENSREGIANLDGAQIAHDVQRESSLVFAAGAGPHSLNAGHAAALIALRHACQFLLEGKATRCVIVAVDSNVLDGNLEWLDRSWRLKSQRNVDGFIPGEAGCAILLEHAATAARRGATVLATVTGVGSADEVNASSTDEQSSGAGLSRAIESACPDAASRPIRWVICDMNGESYRGREWGIALTRLSSRFNSPVIWHPAENIGDVGAASGAIHIAIAARAFARGYAPAERALVWCASDSTSRAACVIGAPSSA